MVSPARLVLLTASLACVLGASHASYDANSGVIQVDHASFDRQVLASKLPVFVEFYAPWCGHCKSLQPKWIQLAQSLKGNVRVAAVDLDQDANRPLASTYGIKGFPTLKLFVKGKAIDYEGPREPEKMEKFALKRLKSKISRVTDAKSLSEFLSASSELPKAILFSENKRSSSMYKAISLLFESRMNFAQVPKAASGLVDRFKIQSFPSFMVFRQPIDAENPSGILFKGEISHKSIGTFLKRFVAPSDDDDQVIPAIADNSCVQRRCVDLGGICVWLVTVPEDENDDENYKHLDVLADVAERSDSTHFRFGFVNGTEQHEFVHQAFAVDVDFPRLIAYSPKKQRFAVFVGSFTESGVAAFLRGILSGTISTKPLAAPLPAMIDGDTEKCPAVEKKKPKKPPTKAKKSSRRFAVKLTDANFDALVTKSSSAWLVEFFAPGCGYCQQLAPHWRKAADNMQGIVKFGAVDCTKHPSLASRFAIRGYPTIKSFPIGAGAQKSSPEDYQGARTAKALAAFAGTMLPNRAKPLKIADVDAFVAKDGVNALFVVTKAKTPALVKAIAKEFEEKIRVATVVTSKKVLAKLSLKEAPAMLVFASGERIEYAGELVADPLRSFLGDLVRSKTTTSTSSDLVPTLSSQSDFDRECAAKLGICVVVLVDDDEAAKREMKVVQSVAEKCELRSLPFHFVKVNRAANSAFAAALGVQQQQEGDDRVGVVAMHVKKARFARFQGEMKDKPLLAFLKALQNGKQATRKLPELPSIHGDAQQKPAETESETETETETESETETAPASCSGDAAGDDEGATCSRTPPEHEL